MWSNRCNGFNQERRPAVSINQSGRSSNKQAGQRGDHSTLLQEPVLNRSDALKSAGWLGIRAGWLIFALFVLDSVAGGSAAPGSQPNLSSAESPRSAKFSASERGGASAHGGAVHVCSAQIRKPEIDGEQRRMFFRVSRW